MLSFPTSLDAASPLEALSAAYIRNRALKELLAAKKSGPGPILKCLIDGGYMEQSSPLSALMDDASQYSSKYGKAVREMVKKTPMIRGLITSIKKKDLSGYALFWRHLRDLYLEGLLGDEVWAPISHVEAKVLSASEIQVAKTLGYRTCILTPEVFPLDAPLDPDMKYNIPDLTVATVGMRCMREKIPIPECLVPRGRILFKISKMGIVLKSNLPTKMLLSRTSMATGR